MQAHLRSLRRHQPTERSSRDAVRSYRSQAGQVRGLSQGPGRHRLPGDARRHQCAGERQVPGHHRACAGGAEHFRRLSRPALQRRHHPHPDHAQHRALGRAQEGVLQAHRRRHACAVAGAAGRRGDQPGRGREGELVVRRRHRAIRDVNRRRPAPLALLILRRLRSSRLEGEARAARNAIDPDLAHPAGVHDRSGVAFEPLAQRDQLALVDEEAAVVVDDRIVEDRLEAGRRRHVLARRPGAGRDLLRRLHQPAEEQLRRVGMRRGLEDRAGERPDRRRVDRGEMRLHRLARLLLHRGDVEDRIERHPVLPRRDAALLAEMPLDEVRLVGHVLVHVVPAVFQHDLVEQPQGRVVVGRVGRDHPALELRFEKIRRRVRHVGRGDVLGVVHVGHGVHHHAVERALGVLEALIDGVEARRLVGQQLPLRLPAHEILQGLEDRGIDLELAVLDLLVDLLVEHVAEAACDRDLDAGIALLEDARRRLPRRGRPADIEHERAFGFGRGVDGVGALRAGGKGGGGDEASRASVAVSTASARECGHDRPPQYVLLRRSSARGESKTRGTDGAGWIGAAYSLMERRA